MQLRYFVDTDTLNVAFGEVGPVARTVDGPNSNILLHFDEDDCLIGLLVEQASETTPFEAIKASPHFERRGDGAAGQRASGDGAAGEPSKPDPEQV